MPTKPAAAEAAPSLTLATAAQAGRESHSEASRLALLGHDLRAAVSDIIGGLRLIDVSGLDEGRQLQFDRVRAASEVLARLLEDALTEIIGEDVSVAEPASLPLGRLLRDVQLRWAGRAREKGLGFEMTLAPGLPRVIKLDRIALERILSNVLSNAVKYTDAGTIAVAVELDVSDSLVFRVRDDGPGFAGGLPGTVGFGHPAPGAAAKPGSGLGLKIAHEMAGRIGGRVSARNRPERGAEMILRIPRSSWQPVAEAPAATLVDLPDLSRMKVLVAEDSETNQTLMRQMLAALGAEVEVVGDGIEALNKLEFEAFDLALIDIEMPRLSGIEVMRAIRAGGGRHANLPIMAVTAYVLRANREAIYAAGADSILAKPLGGIDGFGAAIAMLLERAHVAEPRPEAITQSRTLDSGRFSALLDIAGADGRAELLTRLLSDLNSVERGLVQGCAEPDYAMIRAQTHVLIAVSGAVGAERLMQAARLLNAAAHRRAAEGVKTHGPEVMALLDDLIHFVSGQIGPQRGAP